MTPARRPTGPLRALGYFTLVAVGAVGCGLIGGIVIAAGAVAFVMWGSP